MRRLSLVVLALGLGFSSMAHADAQKACSAHYGGLHAELTWMSAAETLSAQNGEELSSPPAKAVTLALQPTPSVNMPVAPGSERPADPSTFSGWFKLAGVLKPGLYQVSVSDRARIDVVQNGKLTQSIAFTEARECNLVYKSVRFELDAVPTLIELSGIKGQTIKVIVREAN